MTVDCRMAPNQPTCAMSAQTAHLNMFAPHAPDSQISRIRMRIAQQLNAYPTTTRTQRSMRELNTRYVPAQNAVQTSSLYVDSALQTGCARSPNAHRTIDATDTEAHTDAHEGAHQTSHIFDKPRERKENISA